MGVCRCGYCNVCVYVWICNVLLCVCVGFVMCVYVCVGFVMCCCVYVWIFLMCGLCMCGFFNV